jgi:hypothetical protein
MKTNKMLRTLLVLSEIRDDECRVVNSEPARQTYAGK